MKVVHFTHNITDGAGKAAYRLHKALRDEGTDSVMLVYQEDKKDDFVFSVTEKKVFRDVIPKVQRRIKKYRWKPKTLFNFNTPCVSMDSIRGHLRGADIVCIHSIQSFLSSQLIRDIYIATKVPIVWTLMDVEPLTGGCHFNSGCEKYSKNCGRCPQLSNGSENDISKVSWSKKKKDLKDLPIVFVAASSWVEEHIKKSALFKDKQVRRIFLGIDDTVYKSGDKCVARKELGLNLQDKVILFGCFNLDDKRKGADYLKKALKMLENKIDMDSISLVTFGRQNEFSFEDVPCRWIHLGELTSDQAISLAYQSSDILACPSIDDFGPMMANEAFMCDVPIISFDRGISRDLVKMTGRGYLAQKYNVEDFSRGIFNCLSEENLGDLGAAKRVKNMCSSRSQAEQYNGLFEELLKTQKKDGSV